MRHKQKSLHAWMLALALGILAGAPVHAGEPVTLMHVHGLSYSADGKQLLIPSHHGLAVFEDGRWSKAAGPTHDYMGYSATRDALYSSGHPATGSGLTNPFGLIKSRDGGKTWQQLGLTGESDFHTLATSYATNAVYVLNHQPNSLMSQAGIYYTLNDGLKWTRAAAKGLGSKLNSLAVHPTDAKVVAAGMDDGLYLSRNSAESFERLVGGKQVLAANFDLDGQHLWFGSYAGKAALARITLKAGSKAEEVPIPALAQDAVAYIAQNPSRRAEIAIATFKRSVFVSKDQGRTWTQIAKEGVTHE
ncbi:F510_1955 family glycosylhydrolase [Comamonas thiooxydans]|uniref:F510_1955 family glycosylhydrolase n=1 Tax=Comamonas thiooxydans TaxID=363952 RepID=UPI00050F19A2|nr:glycosyl hydrolase [Comamonas thiooxydans]KGH21600.1 glycosyl hydrolase [Comamonas thiooxydans]